MLTTSKNNLLFPFLLIYALLHVGVRFSWSTFFMQDTGRSNLFSINMIPEISVKVCIMPEVPGKKRHPPLQACAAFSLFNSQVLISLKPTRLTAWWSITAFSATNRSTNSQSQSTVLSHQWIPTHCWLECLLLPSSNHVLFTEQNLLFKRTQVLWTAINSSDTNSQSWEQVACMVKWFINWKSQVICGFCLF